MARVTTFPSEVEALKRDMAFGYAEAFGADIFRRFQREIPVLTGFLLRSLRAVPPRLIRGVWTLRWVTLAHYGIYVHQGRRSATVAVGTGVISISALNASILSTISAAVRANPWFIRGFELAGARRIRWIR